MRRYFGVTDGDWHRFLAARTQLDVKFWRPAGCRFGFLQVGEPFFFRRPGPVAYLDRFIAGFTMGAGQGLRVLIVDLRRAR